MSIVAVSTSAPLLHPVFGRIGGTPLVRLDRLSRQVGGDVFAKLESFNPGGSVKDRAAAAIVRDAWERGLLPARRLLDASSGNTGIAYAMLGAALGFGVTICLPASASLERKRLLAIYGAEVIETDPLEGSDGAMDEARVRAACDAGRYFYADQYSHPANPAAHTHSTGPEILEQLGRRPLDLFVAGLGTSGTFVGVSRFLRARSPLTRRVAVQPDRPLHGLEGLKHLASARVPTIFDASLVHETQQVDTDEARGEARRLAAEEGVLVGVSSGAALVAAARRARSLGARTTVVICPDGGERYLSEGFWEVPR